ncbi:leucine-rich repeat and IQ domain-containing protein 4-like [Hylaeus volcanicus]|uniref:leucine-rich repeat and IQ domain-containing protein 4-like n=1 Tax=Hylaeus volcanicus TaxID=313075 RepID=UPI0023B8737D|nr:leucine-rich repeat and IQ domain-containing protein 4-like [Hylaeus volcanicus]
MVILSLAQISSIFEGNLEKAHVLDIKDRNLDSVESLGCMKNLKRIVLDKNRLKSLEFLESNYSLSWISAQYNILGPVLSKSYFYNLTNLSVLNLASNNISNVEGIIESLPQLKVLILSNNLLTSIKGLGRLQQLETLVLSNNKLENFTSPQKPLIYLKKLSLSNNKLKHLCLNENVYNLRELRLNENSLLQMPENLYYCGRLTILDLGKNKFNLNPKECIQQLRRCQKLSNVNLLGNTSIAQTDKEWDSFKDELSKHLPMLKIFNSRNLVKLCNAVRRKKNLVINEKDKSLKKKIKQDPAASLIMEPCNKTKKTSGDQKSSEGKKERKDKNAIEAMITNIQCCKDTPKVDSVFFSKNNLIYDYLNNKSAVHSWNE